MTLPEPPEGYGPDGPAEEPEPVLPKRAFRAFAATSILLFLLIAAVAGLVVYLTEPEVKPTAAARPSEAPVVNVNPCAHETFSAPGCASRMIQGAVQRAGIPPYTVVEIWCSSIFATPKARANIIRTWEKAGAHPDDARAVVRQFTQVYCPQVEGE